MKYLIIISILLASCIQEEPQPIDDGRDRCINEVAYGVKCYDGTIITSLNKSKCDSLGGFMLFVAKCAD